MECHLMSFDFPFSLDRIYMEERFFSVSQEKSESVGASKTNVHARACTWQRLRKVEETLWEKF